MGKYEAWFDRQYVSGDLRARSIEGGVSTISAQIVSFILNIGSTILLARLLLPDDYGLVAMVTSFTGFVLMFKDLGLTQAVIQKDHISQEEVSMVFWLNVYVSIGLGLIVAAMGPGLVAFYGEPRLLPICLAYVVVALLGGLSAQHSALLNRQMRFKSLSRMTMLASGSGLLAGLIVAWLGFGYWALVAINVVNAFVQAIVLWLSCDWRPDWLKIDRKVRDYLHFGAGVTGFNMVNYFSRNLDNILIGRFVGAGALGLYSKAYQLLMLPISQLRDPLNAVGTPALSSLLSDPEKYRSYYREYLYLLAFFSMPIVVFLFISAQPIILLLLGPGWTEASSIFQLLAITALIQPVASTRGMVMLTSGKSSRFFWWGVYNAIAVTIAFFVGVRWGMEGVAIAYAIVNYLILWPSLQYCYRGTPVTVRDFFISVRLPFLASLVAGLGSWFVYRSYQPANLLLECLFLGLLYGLLYLTFFFVSPSGRHRLNQVVSIARSVLLRKRK